MPEPELEFAELKAILRRVLAEYMPPRTGPVGPTTAEGTIELRPGRPGTQGKDIPVEDLLRKLRTVREKIRLFEQKINGHKGIDDIQRLKYHAGITGCYEAVAALALLLAPKPGGDVEGDADAGESDSDA